MARVLLLTLVYGPDMVSTANMMTDIAQGLQDAGHHVTVLTSVPHYNPSPEVRGTPRFTANLRKMFTSSLEHGVHVLRVFMPMKKHKVWARGLDYLLFQILTTALALFRVKSQDVVIVTSPPITLGLSGVVLSKLQGGVFVYDVRELWPDVPVRMGLFRHPLLLRFVYTLEAFVYSQAVAISTIARSFQTTLVDRGVPKQKLYFTPNFVDVELIVPGCKENPFSREHGLKGAFVVLYAGNLGLTQGLEIIIDVAAELVDEPSIQFLIVGDGARRSVLEQNIAASNLPNIRLLPFQPVCLVSEMYAASDVCVAPLRHGFSYDTVPSKIYTAMAAGRPVVASAEEATETSVLLRDAHAGICVPPESASALISAIRELRADPDLATSLGENGRKWIVEHYSRAAVVDTYSQMVSNVAAMRGQQG